MSAEKVKRSIERLAEKGLNKSQFFMKAVNEFLEDLKSISDFSTFSKNYRYFQISNGKLVKIAFLGAMPIKSIDKEFFIEVNDVNFFEIYQSFINNINPNTFQNMPNLGSFSIIDSEINELPENLFSANKKIYLIIVKLSPLSKISKEICDLQELMYVSFVDTNLPKELRRSFEEYEIEDFKSLVRKHFPD